MVKTFYTEKLLPLLQDETAREGFWQNKVLIENDFEGLVAYYYATAFGNEFLSPLEETDTHFTIKVEDDSLKRVIEDHFPIRVLAN